jgi:hypothetical protein
MAVQPITPQEALELKITTIPDEVIEVVNQMLAERMTKNPRIFLLQKDIVANVILRMSTTGKVVTSRMIYDNHWMDFEPFYEKAGWKVVYDKPGYCESYEANFTFTKKD